jgi:hypothetical protein
MQAIAISGGLDMNMTIEEIDAKLEELTVRARDRAARGEAA